MKLLQLNMWMGRLTPQIVELIQAQKPDIVTAQEVFDVSDEVIFPDRMFNVYKEVLLAEDFSDSYFSPLWSIQVSHQIATFGNAIFSKYPIVERSHFFTHGRYNPDLIPETRIENTRNAQVVKIKLGQKEVVLANHHAHWEITPQGSQESVQRIQAVKDRLQKETGPMIFAGDFNVLPNTPTMQLFNGLMEDLTEKYNISNTLSRLGKVNNVACDHILVNDQIKVKDFRVLDDLVSDHKALLMEFEI